MGKKPADVPYQNYDVIFKEAFGLFKDYSLDFLGLGLPQIVEVLDSELPKVSAQARRVDKLFRLADGSLLHFEEEARLSGKDMRRFAGYDLQLAETHGAAIHTVVLTRTSNRRKYRVYDCGSLRYRVRVIDLSKRDGEKLYRRLKRRIEAGEDINPLELVYLPLMRSRESSATVLKRATELTRQTKFTEDERARMVASILALCDKLVDQKLIMDIAEGFGMYKFVKYLEEYWEEKHRGENEAALQEARQEGQTHTYAGLIRDGILTKREAAQRLNISERELSARLKAVA